MAERLDCSLMASMASTKKKGCKYSEDRGRQSEAVFQDSDFTHLKSPIWGLGCNSNLSLNFYILDSVTQWSLLHKLKAKGQNEGSDDNHPQVPKAMIISLNDDKIFAMKGRWLDRQNLKKLHQGFPWPSEGEAGRTSRGCYFRFCWKADGKWCQKSSNGGRRKKCPPRGWLEVFVEDGGGYCDRPASILERGWFQSIRGETRHSWPPQHQVIFR